MVTNTTSITNLGDIMNRFLENKEYKYKGPIIYTTEGLKSDIDFKFKVVGAKKMMSVGEYYDYTIIDVTLVRFNDALSNIFFNEGNHIGSILDNLRYPFEKYVRSILKPFDTDVRVKINEISVKR